MSNVFMQKGDHRFQWIDRRFEEIDVWTVDANIKQFSNWPSPRVDAAQGQPINKFISANTYRHQIYVEDILYYDGNPYDNIFINWIVGME